MPRDRRAGDGVIVSKPRPVLGILCTITAFLAVVGCVRAEGGTTGGSTTANIERRTMPQGVAEIKSEDDLQKGSNPTTPTTNDLTLPGVRIEFTTEHRAWTTIEAASGLRIEYVVRIDDEVVGVQPEPIDIGGCGRPGPSGLIVFEKLQGDGQQYCRCDVGICPGKRYEHSTLHKGSYPRTFEWNGRNWTGPSDTGDQKGKPFPPGQYTLTVSAVGLRLVDGEERWFKVAGDYVFDLVEE